MAKSVSNLTALLLNPSRESNSTAHLIEGWLMCGNSGVQGETVTTTANGESFQNKTDQNGYFNLTLDLEPECINGTYQNATYTITASFAGDQPASATAYDNTLGGTSCGGRATGQYDPPEATASCQLKPRNPHLRRPQRRLIDSLGR
jgi:phosphatidate phosphatase APP1